MGYYSMAKNMKRTEHVLRSAFFFSKYCQAFKKVLDFFTAFLAIKIVLLKKSNTLILGTK